MKYTKLQQRKYDKIERLVALLGRKQDEKYKQIHKIEEEIEEINHLKFKTHMSMEPINKRIKAKCKHKGETHKGGVIFRDFSPKNMRFIFCNDCDESIGSEDV